MKTVLLYIQYTTKRLLLFFGSFAVIYAAGDLPWFSFQGAYYAPLFAPSENQLSLRRGFYNQSSQLFHVNYQRTSSVSSLRSSIGFGMRDITSQGTVKGVYALMNWHASINHVGTCTNFSIGSEQVTRTAHKAINIHLPIGSMPQCEYGFDAKITFLKLFDHCLLTSGFYLISNRGPGLLFKLNYAVTPRLTVHIASKSEMQDPFRVTIGVSGQNYNVTTYAPHNITNQRARLLHIPIQHYEFGD